jgi:hypothetical protein
MGSLPAGVFFDATYSRFKPLSSKRDGKGMKIKSHRSSFDALRNKSPGTAQPVFDDLEVIVAAIELHVTKAARPKISVDFISPGPPPADDSVQAALCTETYIYNGIKVTMLEEQVNITTHKKPKEHPQAIKDLVKAWRQESNLSNCSLNRRNGFVSKSKTANQATGHKKQYAAFNTLDLLLKKQEDEDAPIVVRGKNTGGNLASADVPVNELVQMREDKQYSETHLFYYR